MERNQMEVGEGSRKGNVVRAGPEEGVKYARYTQQQLEVLEKVYTECPAPNYLQRAQILDEQPLLRGVDSKQLKVWFQNRRCRDKQRKETCDLVSENRRLAAANKLLREENDDIQKRITQLIRDNDNMQNQVPSQTSALTYEIDCQLEANNPQMPTRIADTKTGLLLLANETREEFLCKAVGNAIDWTPVCELKLHHLCSVGTLYVSFAGNGVAAQACATIPFDPVETIEMLKDGTSWSRYIRSMSVNAKYPVSDKGTVELVYTQYYAPTIVAYARDFWTLKYTSVLDDGSFVVCEKSISSSDSAPSSPPDAQEFVRGKMLASGYLIRPVEGGSFICLVHHLDFEGSSIPEVVQTPHKSSEFLAKKMVVSALHHIEHMVNKKNDNETPVGCEDPTFLRSFGRRLCRGFDDAVNCFSEDGWTLMNGSDDIIMSIKQTDVGIYSVFDTVICAKTSLLLQNVHPASMVRVLKERHTAWMDFNFADHSVAFAKAACFVFPGPNIHQVSETTVVLGHTDHEDEAFEVIRFAHNPDFQNCVYLKDLYHVQIINGLEDTGSASCSELIFAPLDRSRRNDSALLSSGFRIFLLDSSTGATSSDALNTRNAQANISHPTSLLTVAFQFPFESHLQEDVAAMARQYVQNVVSTVKRISAEIMQSKSNPDMMCLEAAANPATENTPEPNPDVNLANLIYRSYRSTFGVELICPGMGNSDSDRIQQHPYAILCFSFSTFPLCMYANQSALQMLETTPDNLQMLTMDRIFGDSNNLSLDSILPTVLQLGYMVLPAGQSLVMPNRCIWYEQAVMWIVRARPGSVHGLALAFMGWSFY